MRTVYLTHGGNPASSSSFSSSSIRRSSSSRSSSSYSCTLYPKPNNFYNIQLYTSGNSALTTGYSTEHKLIIYEQLGSGIYSGLYETPYIPYSGVIASVTTELPEKTKFEIKTIYKDKNVYNKDGDYLEVQILNLVDINYSNKMGLDLFKKEAINSFNELFCCTDKCYIGFIKFAGKNQVETFDFSNNKQNVFSYISGLSGLYKYNPGSSINEAIDLVKNLSWKNSSLKIINFVTNNKPYISRTSYECYKSDIDFPSLATTDVDDIFSKFNLVKNTYKDVKINVFFVDEIGIESRNFNPILISSSSSRSSSSRTGGGGGSSTSSIVLPSLTISSTSNTQTSQECPCSINTTRTNFECDPCCGIRDAYEDGYKYESLIDINTLEKVCCPPCPDGYYREDEFYYQELECANCVPIISSTSNNSNSSMNSSGSKSSSSKSWLTRSSSSSLNIIKSSSGTGRSSGTIVVCEEITPEEKCCRTYGKCGSSMPDLRCSSESSCSCNLSSENCPKPCPCSINDYGITQIHIKTIEHGTCGAGPECVGFWFEIGMSDVKYTEETFVSPEGFPEPNPDYLCYKVPLSNTIGLKECKRGPTLCPSQNDFYSPVPNSKVPCLVHPNTLGLIFNWQVISLCDGRSIFNGAEGTAPGGIFQRSIFPCKAFWHGNKRMIERFWSSVCVAYGAYGYKIRYWITWGCGILNNQINEFEVKFGEPILCTSENADYWSTFSDQKCCCSSSSSSDSSETSSGTSSATAGALGQQLLFNNDLV